MAGLVPAIHAFIVADVRIKTWMPAFAGMTEEATTHEPPS
jgi:hypothetical protein